MTERFTCIIAKDRSARFHHMGLSRFKLLGHHLVIGHNMCPDLRELIALHIGHALKNIGARMHTIDAISGVWT